MSSRGAGGRAGSLDKPALRNISMVSQPQAPRGAAFGALFVSTRAFLYPSCVALTKTPIHKVNQKIPNDQAKPQAHLSAALNLA